MFSLKTISAFAQAALKNADAKGTLSQEELHKITRLALEECAGGLVAAEELTAEEAAKQVDAAAAEAMGSADELCSDLTGVMRLIRVGGILPHYACKVLACFFAAKILGGATDEVGVFLANNGIRETVRRYCGFVFEAELVDLVARQFAAVLETGSIAEDHKKVAIIKEAYRLGYHYEKVYRGCAQCTIAALFDVTGKKDEQLFRAANGFAAGMGLFGDGACGGYAGGLLILGTYAGRRMEHFDGDKEEKDQNALLAERLHTRFMETYGTVTCENIHKEIFGRAFHIRDAQNKVDFEAAGAHKLDKCTAVVATASQWTAEILLEQGYISAE